MFNRCVHVGSHHDERVANDDCHLIQLQLPLPNGAARGKERGDEQRSYTTQPRILQRGAAQFAEWEVSFASCWEVCRKVNSPTIRLRGTDV